MNMDLKSEFFKFDTLHNTLELHNKNGQLQLRSADQALQSVIELDKPHRLALKNLEYLMAVLLFVMSTQI